MSLNKEELIKQEIRRFELSNTYDYIARVYVDNVESIDFSLLVRERKTDAVLIMDYEKDKGGYGFSIRTINDPFSREKKGSAKSKWGKWLYYSIFSLLTIVFYIQDLETFSAYAFAFVLGRGLWDIRNITGWNWLR